MKNNPLQPIIDLVNSDEFQEVLKVLSSALPKLSGGPAAEKKKIARLIQEIFEEDPEVAGEVIKAREAVDEIVSSLTETSERVAELQLLLDDIGHAYYLVEYLAHTRSFMTANLAEFDELLASVLSNESWKKTCQ